MSALSLIPYFAALCTYHFSLTLQIFNPGTLTIQINALPGLFLTK